MNASAQGDAVTVPAGPGPLTRALIMLLWKRLFDASSENPIYLPRIIRDGYLKWGLPSYDPARPDGTSAPVEIPNVPNAIGDSACARDDMKFPPICSAKPTLRLLNILFTNLSVVQPVSLSFSDTEPVFTAVIGVGTAAQPFTLATNDTAKPNFLFEIGCCEPVSPGSRDCADKHWTADASGTFVAKAHDATITLTIQLNTSEGGPLTITVRGIGVKADPNAIAIDFNVDGQPTWVQQLAQMAVNQGTASGAMVQGMQTFLNQRDVLENVEKLVNEALKNLPMKLPND